MSGGGNREEKRARISSRKTVRSSPVRWEAPERGWLKLNVDASVHIGASSFAIGMIIRDELGSFFQDRSLRTGREVNVIETEAFGILEALKWL